MTARHIGGVMFGGKAITMQYPEEQHIPSPNYRGVHRLNKDEHGRVKCVACMLCATACPAHCIDIVGATAPPSWPDREKYPENFVIDELRCIYCGMCEEACPVEAIELTGLYDLTGLSREEMIFDKTKLLIRVRRHQGPGADAVRQGRARAFGGHEDPGVARASHAGSLRKERTPMTTGDVILAALVVVLGAAGTFLDAAAQARSGPAAAGARGGRSGGEPGAFAVSLFLEAARGAGTRLFLLRFRCWGRSSAAC